MKKLRIFLIILLIATVGVGSFYLGTLHAVNISDVEQENTVQPVSNGFDSELLLAEGQRLAITANPSPDFPQTSIPEEELGRNYPADLHYSGFTEVKYTINGKTMKLEEAIRDGLVTEEELWAYARIDAKNRICYETTNTYNGVTHFTYTYPRFDISFVHDILIATDGEEYTISGMSLDTPRGATGVSGTYIYPEPEQPNILTQEDWGIALAPKDVSPTSITITTQQSGGQQFGQLEISEYMLIDLENNVTLPVDESWPWIELSSHIPITMDATSEITIDWTDTVGSLAPGKYLLRFYLEDIYDPDQVHPFTMNFHDLQSYEVEFTIEK